jgi:hypothetical protein
MFGGGPFSYMAQGGVAHESEACESVSPALESRILNVMVTHGESA